MESIDTHQQGTNLKLPEGDSQVVYLISYNLRVGADCSCELSGLKEFLGFKRM